MWKSRFVAVGIAFGASSLCAQTPTPPSLAASYVITPVAERRVARLPEGRPLYWRVETVVSSRNAASHAGDHVLFATVEGRHWLFTLGPKGGATPGAEHVAEIGPIPLPLAKTYLLRVNHAGGPPGARTPVHSHPGAEAIYVLSGRVTQRTRHGIEHAGAGTTLNAHSAEMAMQLQSTGTDNLSQLVMFVVDADKPFSPPARF